MLVSPKHLEARRANSEGIVLGALPGHGGDVWMVQHVGGQLAAYCFTEFEPVEYDRQEQEIDAQIATWPTALRALYMTLARIRAEAELMARDAGQAMDRVAEMAEGREEGE